MGTIRASTVGFMEEVWLKLNDLENTEGKLNGEKA